MPQDMRIGVISVGARTPLGLTAPASAAAVRAGISLIQEHPFMIDRYGQPMRVSMDARADPQQSGVDRGLALALEPALEALNPILASSQKLPPLSLVIAAPEVRPGWPEGQDYTLVQALAERLADTLPIGTVTHAAVGNAGGISAIGHALSLLRNQDCELCLMGGIESYLEPETLEWLDENQQLHSDGNRFGFCPGEGAGFCLLASAETADRLGTPFLLEVLSAASAHETKLIKTRTVCIGEGLTAAFRKTFEHVSDDSLPLIDHIICDMNGERYRGNEFGFSMLRVAESFREDADFQTPADCWGDLGAASGPLFTMLAANAVEKEYAAGPLTMIWGSSETGLRAAALLQDPYKNEEMC
jgi:3-oxoacyl-[acyl-carrier-protein] synthase-1